MSKKSPEDSRRWIQLKKGNQAISVGGNMIYPNHDVFKQDFVLVDLKDLSIKEDLNRYKSKLIIRKTKPEVKASPEEKTTAEK